MLLLQVNSRLEAVAGIGAALRRRAAGTKRRSRVQLVVALAALTYDCIAPTAFDLQRSQRQANSGPS